MKFLAVVALFLISTGAQALEVGQIVWLKSGSPALTVNKIEGKEISVLWFTGGQYNATTFPEAVLSAVDPVVALDHERAKARASLEIADPVPEKPEAPEVIR